VNAITGVIAGYWLLIAGATYSTGWAGRKTLYQQGYWGDEKADPPE